MDIQINAGKDVMNQWVSVAAKAGAEQQIVRVTTTLDGSVLGSDDLHPPEVSYERTWHQVGSGVPGMTHRVAVTTRDQKGNEESASKTWQDQQG